MATPASAECQPELATQITLLILRMAVDKVQLPSYNIQLNNIHRSTHMSKQKIAFKYQNAFQVNASPDGTPTSTKEQLTMSMMANMMTYGFILSQEAVRVIQVLDASDIVTLHNEIIPILQKAKGAHVKHNPMYKNFPQEVMDMSHFELFVNAITHYWTLGTWRPESPDVAREFAFESTKFQEIAVLTDDEFNNIFKQLVTSKDSISESDRENVVWFMDNVVDLPIPTEIPFKENMCVVAGYMLEREMDITPFIKTTTDVLRVATYLSDGDISLADNTRFKSFPRSMRRKLVRLLEPVISLEDVNRHRNKWVKVFHALHVGDYSKKVFDIAQTFRDNKHVVTFGTKVEAAIKGKHVVKAVELLSTRPGDFARRVDHLLRLTDRKKGFVVDEFLKVADAVDTRVLVQLLGNLKIRTVDNDSKIVFPKGNVQRAIMVEKFTPKLSVVMVNKLKNGINAVLSERFGGLGDLGSVWIDPALKKCPLPTQQRSASESLITVGRGTQLPLGDKDTLRMFIYWKGQDIDLSATLYDEDFKLIEQVSYTNPKSDGFQAYHSGDITRAPNGASEFIDITMPQAVEMGARYVAMNVLVYSGPSFAEHEECFAGWMTRSKPKSNEIYDAKTVEQKVDLRNATRNAIPVMFDLLERKAIWIDVATPRRSSYGGNNIESNRASIENTIEAIATMKNKLSLYELFKLHAEARGTIVESKEDADTVFSMYEGTTPYNIAEINSEYLV